MKKTIKIFKTVDIQGIPNMEKFGLKSKLSIYIIEARSRKPVFENEFIEMKDANKFMNECNYNDNNYKHDYVADIYYPTEGYSDGIIYIKYDEMKELLEMCKEQKINYQEMIEPCIIEDLPDYVKGEF